MTPDNLAALCRQVADFGFRQNWQLLGTPIITWQFETISDFAAAEFALMKAIRDLCRYQLPGQERRAINPGTIELNCYGVTFRITCTQVLDTPLGQRRAAELNFEHYTGAIGWDKDGPFRP